MKREGASSEGDGKGEMTPQKTLQISGFATPN
jgi:hypothetical protein